MLNAARRCARLSHGPRFATATARGVASVTGTPGAERAADAVAADVAQAEDKALKAREAPRADLPLAAGLPETAGRRCLVRPVVAMRSGEPAMARSADGLTWRIASAHAEDDVDRYREPLMGWTASAVPEASMQPDALEFGSATAAVEFAARQGWRPEVEPPPTLPRCNVASIPGAGTASSGKPVLYAANFDVRRGGIPKWPPDGVEEGAPPPYDVDLEPKTGSSTAA